MSIKALHIKRLKERRPRLVFGGDNSYIYATSDAEVPSLIRQMAVDCVMAVVGVLYGWLALRAGLSQGWALALAIGQWVISRWFMRGLYAFVTPDLPIIQETRHQRIVYAITVAICGGYVYVASGALTVFGDLGMVVAGMVMALTGIGMQKALHRDTCG